ncbi:RWD domain-containing protein 4 [Phlebotomus argentipes]|uniref:RWD domain-containing protein 4 n=1 Tax=Phlebotomus argentipes TaxID=94469 RepID=UPI0028930692|nr:RWD domain-containing protein 4 [Phlebotomus argentipes]
MSAKELQDEEAEALLSIYETDHAFKQINPTTYQYKYGEEDTSNSFLVELVWTTEYPNEAPQMNLDTFYNRNLVACVKENILKVLTEEAQQWLGCGMTYTLFECLKERTAELTAAQPEITQRQSVAEVTEEVERLEVTKAPKKEHLTKAQKRRQWERTDHKGDRPRGWNWVDIIRHLSQTGGKSQDTNPQT